MTFFPPLFLKYLGSIFSCLYNLKMAQWSFLCPATVQPHGEAWSCGSCFAQNPRPTTSSRGPELIDLVSESESEPDVIDLVSESESEQEVFDPEPTVDLDSDIDSDSYIEVVDLAQRWKWLTSTQI